MALTGFGVVSLLGLATVVLFVVCTVILPTTQQRRFIRTRQTLCTLGLLLTSLALAFSVMNRQNMWFMTWGDFVSISSQKKMAGPLPSATPAPKPLTFTAATTALQRDPRNNPEIGVQLGPAGQGSWASFTLAGTASGVSSQVLVWLPPSYLDHPEQHYPVVFAFGGFPVAAQHYRDKGKLDETILAATSAHSMREPIVVIPDVYPGDIDSECVDATAAGGQKWETWVNVDVVTWTKQNLRTIDDPRGWAAMGYSAGGVCATILAVKHPHTFGIAANLSGSYAPVLTPGQEWVAADDPRYALTDIADKTHPNIHVFASYGDHDIVAKDGAEAFAKHASATMRVELWPVPNTAHIPAAWETSMQWVFPWMGQISPYFAAL